MGDIQFKRETTRTFDSEASLQSWRNDSQIPQTQRLPTGSIKTSDGSYSDSEDLLQQLNRVRKSNAQLRQVNEQMKSALTGMQEVRDENRLLREEISRLRHQFRQQQQVDQEKKQQDKSKTHRDTAAAAPNEEEVKKLRDRIRVLEKAVSSSERILKEMDKIQEEKEKFEIKCKQLEEDLLGEGDNRKVTEKDSDMLRRENVELKKLSEKLQKEIDDLRYEISLSHKTATDSEIKLKEENRNVNEENLSLRNEITNLKQQTFEEEQNNKAKYTRLDREHNNLKARCSALEEKILHYQEQERVMDKTRSEDVMSLQRQVSTLNENLGKVSDASEEVRELLEKRKIENDELQKELQNKEKEILELKENKENIMKELESMSKELSETKAKLEIYVYTKDDYDTIINERESYKLSLAEVNLSLKKHKFDLEELYRKCEIERQSREADQALLTKLIDEKDLRIDVTNMEMSSAVVQQVLHLVADLRRNVQQSQQQVVSLKEYVEDQAKLTEEKERELEVSRQQLDELGSGHRTVLEENRQLKTLVEYLKETLYSMQVEMQAREEAKVVKGTRNTSQPSLFDTYSDSKSDSKSKNRPAVPRSGGQVVMMNDIYNHKSFQVLLNGGKSNAYSDLPKHPEKPAGSYMKNHIKKKDFVTKTS